MILNAWIWIKAKAVFIAGVLGAAILAFLSIRSAGKSAGKNEEKVKQFESILENVRKRDEVTQRVERMPDGDASRRLRDKWSRD
jgi:hypothetical protein